MRDGAQLALTRRERREEARRSLRVFRHFLKWPAGHPEAPNPRPLYVREFESKHGKAPESAERLLAEFRPKEATL